MNPGDTLIVPRKTEGIDGHFWVIVSDPALDPERVLMVSFTSHDSDKDPTCEISVGEHPFVIRRTLVCYDDARVAADEQLEVLVAKGLMKRGEPVSEVLLQRIRDGAWSTDDIRLDHRQILIDQGLV